MDLIEHARELYALRPDQFTAERNRRVAASRADGDKELAEELRQLPKPSAAVWAINLIVRERPGALDSVLELGASLRRAQKELDRDELRGLVRKRQGLVSAVADEAIKLAGDPGHPVSEAGRSDIEQTLYAALADPDAAAAVLSGRLTRPLASTGWDAVDLAGAVAGAPQSVETSESAEQDTAQDIADARLEVERIASMLAELRSGRDAVAAKTDAVEQRRQRFVAKRDRLLDQLEELEQDITAVAAELASAQREHDAADQAVADAERADRKARSRLDGVSG